MIASIGHGLVVFAIVVLAVSIVFLGVSGTKASIANTSIPDNKVASSVNETGNSASATITITWTTASPPDE